MPKEWRGIEYMLYYPCCSVIANTIKADVCWACNEGTPVEYYHVKELLPKEDWPPRFGGSQTTMQFTLVKEHALKWRHP